MPCQQPSYKKEVKAELQGQKSCAHAEVTTNRGARKIEDKQITIVKSRRNKKVRLKFNRVNISQRKREFDIINTFYKIH